MTREESGAAQSAAPSGAVQAGAGRMLLVLGSVLGCGLAVGAVTTMLVADRRETPAVSVSDSDREASHEALRSALDQEVAARERLTAEVVALRAEIDLITEALSEEGTIASSPSDMSRGMTASEVPASERAEVDDKAAALAADEIVSEADLAEKDRGPRWFDTASLSALGLTDSEIARLKDMWEDYEMDKLYLQDRAARDSARPGQTRQQRAALEGEMRQELGERDYDLMLYASGQSNRVQVMEILGRSPGLSAGLAPGDTILSYDGLRVYRPQDLRSAIASASEGTLVRVEVETAGGDLRSLRLPAGPIGIRMAPGRSAPR